MAQLVLVVLAALAAAAGYWEMEKFTQERGRSLFGVSPRRWAIGCGLVGLVAAFFMPALVLAALTGVVGYNEARKLQEIWREAPYGIPVPVWVVLCAVFGFVGATLASAGVWLVVSGFLALAGALFLGIEERYELANDKRVLLAENRRLLRATMPSSNGGAQPAVSGTSAARQP